MKIPLKTWPDQEELTAFIQKTLDEMGLVSIEIRHSSDSWTIRDPATQDDLINISIDDNLDLNILLVQQHEFLVWFSEELCAAICSRNDVILKRKETKSYFEYCTTIRNFPEKIAEKRFTDEKSNLRWESLKPLYRI